MIWDTAHSGRKEGDETTLRGSRVDRERRAASRKADRGAEKSGVIKRAVNEARISEMEATATVTVLRPSSISRGRQDRRGRGWEPAYAIRSSSLRYRDATESSNLPFPAIVSRARSITEQKRPFWNKLNAQLNLWMRHARDSSWYRVTSALIRPELVSTFLFFFFFFLRTNIWSSCRFHLYRADTPSHRTLDYCIRYAIRYARRLLDSSSLWTLWIERNYIYRSFNKVADVNLRITHTWDH